MPFKLRFVCELTYSANSIRSLGLMPLFVSSPEIFICIKALIYLLACRHSLLSFSTTLDLSKE